MAQSLEERGLMIDFGRKKIEESPKNGQWYAPKSTAVAEEQIAYLSALLEEYEPAYTNFQYAFISKENLHVSVF